MQSCTGWSSASMALTAPQASTHKSGPVSSCLKLWQQGGMCAYCTSRSLQPAKPRNHLQSPLQLRVTVCRFANRVLSSLRRWWRIMGKMQQWRDDEKGVERRINVWCVCFRPSPLNGGFNGFKLWSVMSCWFSHRWTAHVGYVCSRGNPFCCDHHECTAGHLYIFP